ncbi:hypothetical protein [Vibrio parahaemolyticus]|uniref:hypothetical protein n=1 Tax=Vibrio parahaemolyticus TaxID=670 RepID=UPI003D81A7C5
MTLDTGTNTFDVGQVTVGFNSETKLDEGIEVILSMNFHPEDLQIVRGANPDDPDEVSVRDPQGNELTTCEGHFTDFHIRKSFKHLQNYHC